MTDLTTERDALRTQLAAAEARVAEWETGRRSRLIPYPDHWPRMFNPPGSNEPCDMLSGPCCCGAYHSFGEWNVVEVQRGFCTGRKEPTHD